MDKKASPCQRAIIVGGEIVGWEEFRPVQPSLAKISSWGNSPAGKAARSRFLEEKLVPITSTQSTWEAEAEYGRYLYPAWTEV